MMQVTDRHYRAFMHGLVGQLEALYASGLPPAVVQEERGRTLEDARSRYAGMQWLTPGYARALRPERDLNNAELLQFREAFTLIAGKLAATISVKNEARVEPLPML